MKYILLSIIFPAALLAGDFEYVGTKKCQACHKKEENGNQHGAWLKSKHAQSWDLLMGEDAVKIAREANIQGPPHKAPDCVKCHAVGFGKGGYEIKDDAFWNPDKGDKEAAKAVSRMEHLRNVGCESCHGPGSEYSKKKIMAGIFDGSLKAEDYGLDPKPGEENCKQCHNEHSTKPKPFDYKKAVEAIAHPYPEGYRDQ